MALKNLVEVGFAHSGGGKNFQMFVQPTSGTKIIGFNEAKIEKGELIPPTFELTSQAAQSLLDDMWEAGFRPSGFAKFLEDRDQTLLSATSSLESFSKHEVQIAELKDKLRESELTAKGLMAGSVAQDKHLQDMRSIVFSYMELKK